MDNKLNIQEIDFEKLMEELIKESKDSLAKRIREITKIQNADEIDKILQILCTLNVKLSKEYRSDIRNWVSSQPLSIDNILIQMYQIDAQASNCQSS